MEQLRQLIAELEDVASCGYGDCPVRFMSAKDETERRGQFHIQAKHEGNQGIVEVWIL